jgi:hypothetical protein
MYTAQYFLKYAFRLFLASTLVLGLVLVISRLQPPSPQSKTLEKLHLLDCPLPCWIGIIPGKTTIGEARTHIENAYPSEHFEISLSHNVYDGTDWLNIKNRQDDNSLSVQFNEWQPAKAQTENTIVREISIIGAKLTLGEWYFVLGRPQALSITWGNHVTWPNMLYDRQNVRLTFNVSFDFAVDNPNIVAGSLDVYEQAEMDNTYGPSYRVKWHGFSASNKDELLALMQP